RVRALPGRRRDPDVPVDHHRRAQRPAAASHRARPRPAGTDPHRDTPTTNRPSVRKGHLMKRTPLAVAAAIAGTLILSACTGNADPGSTGQEPAPETSVATDTAA